MAATKTNTKAEREELRHRIWQLRNRGLNQFQIAAEVGLSRRMVVGHMKIMENRWRQECAEGIEAHKEKLLAASRELERTYWEAWLRSLDEKITTQTERTERERTERERSESDSDTDSGSRRKVAIKKEQKEGNPAFLAGIDRCQERQAKILGVDAPVKIDASVEAREKVMIYLPDNGRDTEGADANQT